MAYQDFQVVLPSIREQVAKTRSPDHDTSESKPYSTLWDRSCLMNCSGPPLSSRTEYPCIYRNVLLAKYGASNCRLQQGIPQFLALEQ